MPSKSAKQLLQIAEGKTADEVIGLFWEEVEAEVLSGIPEQDAQRNALFVMAQVLPSRFVRQLGPQVGMKVVNFRSGEIVA